MKIPKTWHDSGHKMHFVQKIIDGENTIIVYKFWRKTVKRWCYLCDPEYRIIVEIKTRAEWEKKYPVIERGFKPPARLL